MKPPKDQEGVREFLGMVGYFRKIISRFADVARPMTNLPERTLNLNGLMTVRQALKTCLTEAPIPKYPNPHKR